MIRTKSDKSFKAKTLVFDKYVFFDDDGNIVFKSELKSSIDKNNISKDDALNIVYELMYGVINYNHDENKVKEELFELVDKVKEYNLKDENNIKNSVLFFKDYTHEKNLIHVFGYNKKIKKDNETKDNLSKNDNLNSHESSKLSSNDVELSVREKMELDKEIRRIATKIRKDHPYYWREILKTTPVYKKRHGILDSEIQNDEIKEVWIKENNENNNDNKKTDSTFDKKRGNVINRRSNSYVKKTAPLYNWQKDTLTSRNNDKKEFIRKHYDELEFSKKYITKSDAEEIYKKYSINKEDLYEIINEANEKFIKTQKYVVTNEFNLKLSSFERFINSKDRLNLKLEFNKSYFNFFDELNFDELINEENKFFIESEKSKRLNDIKLYLSSCDSFIDEKECLRLKSKYNENYFNFFDELNMEELISTRNFEIGYEILSKELNLENEYISNSKFLEIKSRYGDKLIDWDSFRDVVNESYIKNQWILNKKFFENINGKSLDDNQRIAILTEDDNNQIVAGAGTGKTLTIQGKVKYLIEKKNVAPEDILCISFSNSARDDLADKLERTVGDVPIEVRTFHSLGYSILGINEEYKDVPEYELINLIDNRFKALCNNKPELLKSIIEFFCFYFNIIYINEEELKLETIKSRIESLDEYDEYLKEYLQLSHIRKRREYMHTIPELIIANYLFINNIDYEYSKQAIFKEKYYEIYFSNYSELLFGKNSIDIPDNIKLEFINEFDEEFGCKKIDYYPTFFLPSHDIYIDLVSTDYGWEKHFDNDKKEKIRKKLELRKKINDSYSTKILTLFNHNEDVDGLLKDIENNLLNNHVSLDNIDYAFLFDILISQDNLLEYKRFLKTIEKFITLFKGNAMNIDYEGNNISKSVFKKFNKDNHNQYVGAVEKRNNFYLKIIEEIYEIYCDYLDNNDLIDFDDMINDAVVELRRGGFIHNYKYIIVDEYQDTSHTRYNLLKEAQNVTGAKVVVVGDDWQSIYGFTGCDVNLFSNFEEYFEHPKMVKINITRRNSQKLIDVAGEFIQKNKNQIPKRLKSVKFSNETPIKLFEYVSRAEEVLALMNILNNISEEKDDAEVLILGRNNDDIYEISCKEIFVTTQFKDFTKIYYDFKPNLKIEFRTVHKSKGLEADYVIVLNLNNQINGFPNKIANDPILDFVTNTQDENIDYPEERRLFYVALTRTKNDVYLFSKFNRPSEFVNEIRTKNGVEKLNFVFSNEDILWMNTLLQKKYEVIGTDNICPNCKSGKINLIVNNEKGTSYFRCSNFCGWNGGSYHNSSYGEGSRKLSYVKYAKVCPKCNGMLLVKQNSINGNYFLGCNSFPDCRNASNIIRGFQESDDIILNHHQFSKKEKINKTRFGVYYIDEYIPKDKIRDYKGDYRVKFSSQLLDYKNNKGYSVNLLTNDLIELVVQLSNNEITGDVDNLALIAVPPSKVKKLNKSSMRKSIDIIENYFVDGELENDYNCNKKIINLKDLIKRVKDVPTAHLGEGRASPEEHIDSIECSENQLSNENTAYIVLDDITTTGNSMKACNEILLKNGVESNNIYNIAIGATVRDDDEEI